MQPRTLQQVIDSLGSIYDPQVQSVQAQMNAIPDQMKNDEAQLEAKKNTAYDDILNGARARGVGFGGIPLGEQAKYSATEYMPALANLRTAAKTRATSLQDAINQIYERRANQGQQVYQYENDFFESKRRYDEQAAQAAAERAAAARAGGGGGGGSGYSGGSDSFLPQEQVQQAAAQKQQAQAQRDYNFVKSLITQVNMGNGNITSSIIQQAKKGDPRSKEVMRAFYQLQGKPIPAGFRSFL